LLKELAMQMTTFKAALMGVALFSLGTATGLYAQASSDSAQRLELKRADLSGAANMEVIVSTAEYKPGESLPRHSHPGLEAAYILQGTDVQVPDKPPMTLATGASLLNLRDAKHAGFKVVGPTSLKLFTVHVVDKGAPLYDYAH
jgi:quercetin dioxygenase-like cupin family protein